MHCLNLDNKIITINKEGGFFRICIQSNLRICDILSDTKFHTMYDYYKPLARKSVPLWDGCMSP